MDSSYLWALGGMALFATLLIVRPKEVGKILGSFDPRGFTPEQLTKRTRLIGCLGLVFCLAIALVYYYATLR